MTNGRNDRCPRQANFIPSNISFLQRKAKTWRKTDAYPGTVMELEVFLMKMDRDASPPLFFRCPQLPRTRVIMTFNDN